MYFLALWQESGLTWSKVIADIPHDVPAIVMYCLIAVCGFALWKANRGSGKGPDTPSGV